MKSRRETNLEATRAALLLVARTHFASEGYSHAEIGRIAQGAGVTTGAIYHHFSSKKGLFQAVAEQLESEILAAAATVEADDPWLRLRAGFAKLIDVCASAEVQRIIFVEAPQVVGPEAWREIELRYAFGAVRGVLGALMQAGIVKQYPIDLLARTLLALLRETSAEVARSNHDPEVRMLVASLADRVLDALTV
jgi:AcrR family transcriptional regulator